MTDYTELNQLLYTVSDWLEPQIESQDGKKEFIEHVLSVPLGSFNLPRPIKVFIAIDS